MSDGKKRRLSQAEIRAQHERTMRDPRFTDEERAASLRMLRKAEAVGTFGKVLSDPRFTEGERRGARRVFITQGGFDLGFKLDEPLPPKPKKRKGRKSGPE